MADDEQIVETVQEETVVPEQTVEQPVQAAPAEPQAETPAQASWRQLRDKAERAEKRAQELERELETRKPVQKQVESEEDDEISIKPDDLVEGKHLGKYDKKMRKLEARINEYQAKTYEINAEARIKQEFPDYDKVVTQESLYILQSQFPELAASISSNPDLYSKAKAAHLAITKLGINPNDTSAQQNAINKNVTKPKPLASIAPQQGDSPLTRANAFANGLTQEVKDQLYKEALEAANSR